MKQQFTPCYVHLLDTYLKSTRGAFTTLALSTREKAHLFQFHIGDSVSDEQRSTFENCGRLTEHRMRTGVFALPYPCTLFEIHTPNFINWLFLTDHPADPHKVIMMGLGCDKIKKQFGSGGLLGSIQHWCHPNELNQRVGLVGGVVVDLTNSEPIELTDAFRKQISWSYGVCTTLIALMTLTGVSIVSHVPPERLNASRAKHDKPPFIAYRTLVIEPGKLRMPRIPKGGTHASPAEHERRAHMRTLKNGREIPIQATKVGSRERGIVLKDYEIRLPPDGNIS
jgi:hypothetical protein